MKTVLDAIRTHAQEIARQAGELAEHLENVNEAAALPLPLAVGLVDLEDVRKRLALAADAILTQVEPKHAKPASDR